MRDPEKPYFWTPGFAQFLGYIALFDLMEKQTNRCRFFEGVLEEPLK